LISAGGDGPAAVFSQPVFCIMNKNVAAYAAILITPYSHDRSLRDG
jgi:hypothetical protein